MAQRKLGNVLIDIPTRKITKSKALKRVIKHGLYEGIFLSKVQLINLITRLEGDSSGIWFMVGDSSDEGTAMKTIELIPIKITTSKEPKITTQDFVKGKLNLDPLLERIINNQSKAAFDNDLTSPTMRRGQAQRTPPPRTI